MAFRTLAARFAVTIAAFVALDAVWLTLAPPRLYKPALGSLLAQQPDVAAALLFYAVYLSALTYFAQGSAVRAAVFGLAAYATYDLTNQATLAHWPWTLTVVDLAWGSLASATAVGVARLAESVFGGRTA